LKILVTGAGALLGQGIIRVLKESALGAYVIAVDPSPLAPGLYWADEAHLVPLAKSPDYLARIRAVLERTRPDAILIGTDVELELFARHRAELESEFGCAVVVSSPRVVGIADDKYQTYLFLKEHGFPYPDSCLPGEEGALLERVGFPLVVKPRVGARSIGVHVVQDRRELTARLGEIERPVIQEHVASSNEEYTAGALCFDGQVEATIVMRRDLRDGNTYRAYVEPFPELNAQVRAFAERLAPHGPVNFQFRLDAGQAKVFEINARFSGTTPFRHRAGFHEVDLCLRRLVLGEKPAAPRIEPMILLRYWAEMAVSPAAVIGEG
jgi:carbamoyl-phosphate synthase large subunit